MTNNPQTPDLTITRATKAAGIKMSLSEIAIYAAQAAKTVQKLLETGRQRPEIVITSQKRRRSGR